MKYIRKTKHQFHAIKWKKIEKPRHEVSIKEESFKDLNTKVHYPISSAYRGFSMMGGKSNKCRYA
tara:strand:- start:280 stop:474 length:195 start_codon:yes stop_codon:yes gene_type:complete